LRARRGPCRMAGLDFCLEVDVEAFQRVVDQQLTADF
jgi:hypothetical protein